ncbi:MAG: 50S ribosomal protein L39e [Candidatus Ranarchaeia archaeon]
MARNKTLGKKLRLGKAGKQIRNMPAWIVVKTGGRVRSSPHQRRWRSGRIKA